MKLATTLLIFCVGLLLSLGLVVLYSAGTAHQGAHYLVMQLVWCMVGLGGCLAAASVPYSWLRQTWLVWSGYLAVAALLAAVLVFGKEIKGAQRWLDFGFFRLQPSELSKIILVIALAWYMDRFADRMKTFLGGMVVPGIIAAGLLGLIFIEPDWGTTVLLSAVTAVMMAAAGVRWRYLIPTGVLGLITLAVGIYLDDMRRTRFLAFLNLEAHQDGVGWQQWQALLALGSGGWTGKGLGDGRQKLGFVPEHHTDFILSVVGEEMGLAVTLGVLAAFLILFWCAVIIARGARDNFGRLLATGFAFLIGLQAFINIGVVTSALPNKGIPLPFLSYGGSDLAVMLTCIGLLFSVARQAPATVPALAPLRNRNVFASPISP